ncbi:PREDICTED: uncharacterized protein LOC108562878 isoform X1 [Nicrophorus vespilloides]|uniref:Uncharacterized protein LOC108562878 isoform X1 n=1 Tax=Nicrophorus vespilloides TaxID=110193 RepID=A0ABM1MQL3_NICVS|nr:PREDICTED: uncharacterized protein LOC108562878 isoform X1 [Nicrophorus vespilloides]
MEMDAAMDLLQGVQEADAPAPSPGDFKMPSLDKLLEALDGFDMPEEEKAKLKESLTGKGDFLSKMGNLGAGMLSQKATAPPPIGGGFDPTTQYMIFFAAFVIILVIFVFFGYRLYSSLMLRERKREEKKKQKLQKKKK